MTLEATTRLGPYEILSLLGVGGMGEVYRARDTRLNRDVAIKILPPAVADHPSRRSRFAREARSISQLSHPNICTIYDVGRERPRPARGAESPSASEREPSADHAGGGAPAHKKKSGPASPDADVDGAEVDFLVMEYIEGESLDKRLRRGALPWALALEWSIQIAAAIDAAHKRGIVHRDLKPANIMLKGARGPTPTRLPDGSRSPTLAAADVADCTVKLLDFGLAKLFEGADEANANKPTESITTEHKLLGTLHYMSPEQLEGREVDARTDVFAFGVTLYEMVTGRKAFSGTSAASVSAAILTAEPAPVSSSAAGKSVVAPGLDHIIRRALAKHPDERWQTARDMMLELRWLKDGRPRTTTTASSTSRGPRWLAVAAGATAVALLAGTLGWRIGLGQRGPAKQPPIVFTIAAPPGTRLGTGFRVRVSPDGRKVAFNALPEAGGPRMIWWRSLDSATAVPLLGSDEGVRPFWSPDSASIGFYSLATSQLKRIAITGGAPVIITAVDSRNGEPGAFWSQDDTITFGQTGGLYRVNARGGAAVQLTSSGAMPGALPNGRFLYLVARTNADRGLKILGPGLSAPIAVAGVESNAVFAAGHLVFRSEQALVARPFDARRALNFTGPAVALVAGVSYNDLSLQATFDVSDDVLVYRLNDPRKLTWKDRGGRSSGSIGESGRDMNPAIAPDGSDRFATDRSDPKTNASHVWTSDPQGRLTQVTNGAIEKFPTWTPDGTSIVYTSINAGVFELRRRSATNAAPEETLLRQSSGMYPLDVSRDGRFLIYCPIGREDLWALPLTGNDRTPQQITHTPEIQETTARLSPDGRWLAYTAGERTEMNIWVQEFPGGAPARQVSVNGGRDPNWRVDGKELYYMALTGLMAVDVTTGPSLVFGAPKELFKVDLGNAGVPLHLYSASPDGQRFLVSEVSGEPQVITVVVHWTSLLP